MRDEVDLRYSFHHGFILLKLCGHRHTTVPGDINKKNTMRERGCGCSEVVVDVEGSVTTTS